MIQIETAMTPYTPAAISYVRSNASLPAADIAHALGWDLETLKERARKHNIELCGAEPARDMIFQPPKRDENPCQVHGHVDIMIDEATTLERIIESLPLRQAQVLNILKRDIDGRFISAAEIGDRMGIASKSVGTLTYVLRVKLLLSKWRLDSHRSRAGGGYRLVTRS